jgi:hypothetical protein
MDLESLRKYYGDDMRETQEGYIHWYNFNQRFKNYLFLAGILTGTGTLLTAATLEGAALKFAAAGFGALSTVAAALQRFLKAGAKAEFYGRYVKEVHVLRLRLLFAKAEEEFHGIVKEYAAILLSEGKLSRNEDDSKTLSDEMEKLKERLENDEPRTR